MDFAGGTAVHITSGTAVLAFYVFYEVDTKGFSRCWKGFWKLFIRRVKKLFGMLGLVPRATRPGANDDQDSDHELEDQSPNGQAPRGHNSTHPLGDQSPNGQGSRGHNSTNPLGDQLTNGQGDRGQNSTNPLEDLEAAIPPIKDQPGLGLGADADEPPHNVNNMVLGTALLWIGWFGFNGGSALGGNLRAVSACVSTHVAACAGGTTSLLLFWLWNTLARTGANEGEKEQKLPSVTHFCDGAVIGLVAITPAAGYASLHSTNSHSQLTDR